jgi:hypothetical protein
MFQKFEELSIAPVSKQIARVMILDNHYSHKWNTGFGLENYGIYLRGELMGVAVYGHPMNPQSWGRITTLPADKCLELNRLWISDDLGKNSETWLMAQSMKILKSKGYELIQSFADGRLGVGTIYQAANFGYYGKHKTLFHKNLITQEAMHDTQFNNTANFSGMISRNCFHAKGELKSFTVNTYRYLMPLNRNAQKSILLKQLAYPKERLGMINLPDYKPATGQVARALALAIATNDTDSVKILWPYLEKLTPNSELELEKQQANKWVIKAKNSRTLESNLF